MWRGFARAQPPLLANRRDRRGADGVIRPVEERRHGVAHRDGEFPHVVVAANPIGRPQRERPPGRQSGGRVVVAHRHVRQQVAEDSLDGQ